MAESVPLYDQFCAEAKRLGHTVRRAKGRRLPHIHIKTTPSLLVFIRSTTLSLSWYTSDDGYDVYPPGGPD